MNEERKKSRSTYCSDENQSKVVFRMGGMLFEYDEGKNRKNIEKHGISFRSAARVFFDYDRIEFFDEENSVEEDRYNTIGDLSAGTVGLNYVKTENTVRDNYNLRHEKDDILYVVYTERVKKNEHGTQVEVTRIISARYATNFERGIYYGKYE